ncbi:MAG: hypothetical protein WBK26_03575 [Burkholderiaceae bacterium]
MKFSTRIGTIALALVALSGCASTTPAGTPEQVVGQLAQQRWAHLIDGRWTDAYAMLTPAYRALHTQREYQGTFKGAVTWKSTKVLNTTCEPEKCEVRMELTISNPMARRADDTITTNFTETWLQDGGRWYHYEKP